MTWVEVLLKLLPWILGGSIMFFFYAVITHLKHAQQKAMSLEIQLGEEKINAKYHDFTDDDVVNELNRRESPVRSDAAKKE